MEEQDEQFSGNELDEAEDETNKSIPEQQPIEGAEKKYKGKGRLWLFISRSHAPAWECMPYRFPRWSMGTRQADIKHKV